MSESIFGGKDFWGGDDDYAFSRPPGIKPFRKGLAYVTFRAYRDEGVGIGDCTLSALVPEQRAKELDELSRRRSARGEPLRRAELEELLTRYCEESGPVLVGGD